MLEPWRAPDSANPISPPQAVMTHAESQIGLHMERSDSSGHPIP